MKIFVGILGGTGVALCILCAAVCVADFIGSVRRILRKARK